MIYVLGVWVVRTVAL